MLSHATTRGNSCQRWGRKQFIGMCYNDTTVAKPSAGVLDAQGAGFHGGERGLRSQRTRGGGGGLRGT